MDCGSGNNWRDAGCDTADELLTMGCRRVDRVILTHFDDDHVNGVEHLLARMGGGDPDDPESGGRARRWTGCWNWRSGTAWTWRL